MWAKIVHQKSLSLLSHQMGVFVWLVFPRQDFPPFWWSISRCSYLTIYIVAGSRFFNGFFNQYRVDEISDLFSLCPRLRHILNLLVRLRRVLLNLIALIVVKHCDFSSRSWSSSLLFLTVWTCSCSTAASRSMVSFGVWRRMSGCRTMRTLHWDWMIWRTLLYRALCQLILAIDHFAHNAASFEILRLIELLQDGLQVRFGDQIGQLEVILGARFQLNWCVLCLLLQILGPNCANLLFLRTISHLGLGKGHSHCHIQSSRSL